MEGFSEILGHGAQLDRLRQAVARGKVAHALLFSGPSGVGKRTIARSLMITLNHLRDDRAERVREGNHPDLIEVAPDGAVIKVGQVRALSERLALAPHEARFRLVIIDGAESLHPSAGNALLKSVEEPPQGTIFVLVTNAVHRVLPTLRSRCQRINFGPLGDDHLRALATKLAPEQGTPSTQALRMAEGSIGRLLSLLNDEQLDRAQEIVDAFEDALGTGEATSIFAVAGELSGDRSLLAQVLDVFQTRLHSRLREAAAAPGAPDALLRSLHHLDRAQQSLQFNANPSLTLETLGLQLAKVGAAEQLGSRG